MEAFKREEDCLLRHRPPGWSYLDVLEALEEELRQERPETYLGANFDHILALRWNEKGIALGRLGRLQEALLAFEQALALYPDNSTCWRNKGIAHHSLGQYEAALDARKHSFMLFPFCRDTYEIEPAALLGVRRFKSAARACEHAVQLDLFYACSYYLSGTDTERSSRRAARHRYQRASEIRFGDKLGMGGPDGHFPRKDYYQLVLRYWERTNHRDAHWALAHASKAHILTGLKQYDEALTECAEALRRDPTLLAAYGNQAHAYARLQLYEHALAVYDEVLREHPAHDHFLMGKAAVLLRLGSNEEARSTFTRAMELRWRWPMAAAT